MFWQVVHISRQSRASRLLILVTTNISTKTSQTTEFTKQLQTMTRFDSIYVILNLMRLETQPLLQKNSLQVVQELMKNKIGIVKTFY